MDLSAKGQAGRGLRAAVKRYWWVLPLLSIMLMPVEALGLLTLGRMGLGGPACAFLAALALLVITIGARRDRRSSGPRPPHPRVTIEPGPATGPVAVGEHLLAA